ncbi:alpha/beta hydrolase domain-containing protein [Blastococcus sp. SYSU DS1024]
MPVPTPMSARAGGTTVALGLALALLAPALPAGAADDVRVPLRDATVTGPLPSDLGGSPLSDDLAETYPFFATYQDLAGAGYVEEEFLVSGLADAYASPRTPDIAPGTLLEEDVPYTTRIVVRRPANPRHFSGTALVEWQNVTAGYDLDALWNFEDVTRGGDAWIGVSAQQVGVDQLREWSPTRYGSLDVTAGGEYALDQLAMDIYAQAAKALVAPTGVDPMGGLDIETLLSIGASQSTRYQSAYYDHVLPKVEPVFDGYAIIVGTAPSRAGDEPVFQVQSETDVTAAAAAARRPDDEVFRRWEVAGAAHSGWQGQEYRAPLSERDLGGAPQYTCDLPPFSRVPMHHVTAAAYAHLARWAEKGIAPPSAPYLEFDDQGEKVRNELGLAQGGIQLSQVAVPTALNAGYNSGASFCRLFGTHQPFTLEQLSALYPRKGEYINGVLAVDHANLRAGYIEKPDAKENYQEALVVERQLRQQQRDDRG